MRIAHAIGKAFQNVGQWLQRSAQPSAAILGAGWGGSTPGARGMQAWLREGERSARLNSVWSLIAESVAANPCFAARLDKAGRTRRAPDSRLAAWLKKPWITNGGGTLYTLFYLTQGWIELTGEALWLVRKDNQGIPIEVWPIPPHWLATKPTASQPYYWLSIPGEHGQVTPEKVHASDVIWFKRPSLTDPYGRGIGRAQAVDDEVTQDELASKWESSFFRNGAKPDMVVFAGGLEDNPGAAEVLRRQWDEQHRGVMNAHRPAFLPTTGKIEMLNTNLKEMAFVELRTQHRDIIWQNWAVSPEILGAVENSNRASAEAAQYLFGHNVVRPRLIWLFAELERWFVPLFRQPEVFFAYENPVKETEELKNAKIEMLGKNGFLTRDEVREAAGFEPVGDERGQEFLQPYNVVSYGPNGFNPAPRPPDNSTTTTTTTETVKSVSTNGTNGRPYALQ